VPTPAERLQAAGEEAARLLAEARQATREQRYTEAIAWVDSLIVVATGLPAAHYQRGQILMELYQLQAADSAFQQTMALDPYHWGGWYKRGHVAFEQGQYREAIRRYQRQRDVILASPEELHAYYRRAGEAALPQTWLQIGRAYELLHLPDSARYAYEEVLALDSIHVQAHAWLAGLYAEEGRTQKALTHARQAWRHGNGNPDVAYQLGSLLFENGNLEEALPLFEHVAAAQPWKPGVHYNLGRILIALGRTEEGQRHLAITDQLQDLDQEIDQARAAAAQFPNEPARWRVLAGLLGHAGRRKQQQQALAVARAVAQNADEEPRSAPH
jgi:tetratricopeptide (TPR) repeat protein